MQSENGVVLHHTRLMQHVPYTILAAANLGYELPCRTLAEAKAYRYHLAYPDEFTPGMPMAAVLDQVSVGEDGQFSLPLKRLMARIDLQIDRTALDQNVDFTVRSVKIGGCPSSIQLFNASSKAESGIYEKVAGSRCAEQGNKRGHERSNPLLSPGESSGRPP